jgi:ABC-type sugar transport system substrate-binding protein
MQKETAMRSSKFRLLLLAALLSLAALPSLPVPAKAQCTRICWIVSPETACCRLTSCEIVC